jgi:hypothetical protein
MRRRVHVIPQKCTLKQVRLVHGVIKDARFDARR